MAARVSRIIAWFPAILLAVWGIMLVLWSPGLPEEFRAPAVWLILTVFVLAFLPWRLKGIFRLLALFCFVSFGALWASITPTNDKDWAPEVSQTPWAEVSGFKVTLHNVRNFSYRTETDFDPHWETRTVNLNELSGVDFIASYWAGKAIAHIIVSFAFNERDFIAFSIETRKEKSESYSTVDGFFRNYELVYVAADERDVLGLRTTHRNPPEQVHVLRTDMPLENGKKLFLQYIRTMNRLKEHPAFYNTLTTNCTTQILSLARSFSTSAVYNWKILLSGYVPDLLFEGSHLAPGFTLEELMKRGRINDRSRAAGAAADYSIAIRQGVPKPEPRTVR